MRCRAAGRPTHAHSAESESSAASTYSSGALRAGWSPVSFSTARSFPLSSGLVAPSTLPTRTTVP
eukprot:3284867-Alexandrium_andersonii.AAC.1